MHTFMTAGELTPPGRVMKNLKLADLTRVMAGMPHLLELAQAQLGVGLLGGGVHEGDGQLLHLALQVLGLALQPRRLVAAPRQLALQVLPGLDARCTRLAL